MRAPTSYRSSGGISKTYPVLFLARDLLFSSIINDDGSTRWSRLRFVLRTSEYLITISSLRIINNIRARQPRESRHFQDRVRYILSAIYSFTTIVCNNARVNATVAAAVAASRSSVQISSCCFYARVIDKMRATIFRRLNGEKISRPISGASFATALQYEFISTLYACVWVCVCVCRSRRRDFRSSLTISISSCFR